VASDYELEEVFREGTRLDVAEAKRLEEQLRDDDGDAFARLRLLGHYLSHLGDDDPDSAAHRAVHVCWLIERCAREPIARFTAVALNCLDGPAAWEALERWREQVARFPVDVNVLLNGAYFAFQVDRDLHREWRERARPLADSERCLGLIDDLEVEDLQFGGDSDELRLARLEAIVARSPARRSDTMVTMTKLSFALRDAKRAAAYAKELLDTIALGESWDAGNAHFYGHTTLGRLALYEDNLQGAKEHLILSGRLPRSSPQLSAFGPSMELAEELLERGEREIVLEFFGLCEAWWEMGKKKLETWTADVRQGRMPSFDACAIDSDGS